MGKDKKSASRKKVKQNNNKTDIVFQIIDWNHFDEEVDGDDGESMSKFAVRLYGTTKDKKKIYVKVENFTPYFYIKIPKNWRKNKINIFINEIKRRVYYEYRDSLIKYDSVDKHDFYGFTNYKLFNFIRLIFCSYGGFLAYRRVLYKKIFNRSLAYKPTYYKMYEPNIEPMLRFMHIRNLEACGWVRLPKGTYHHFSSNDKPSYNDINVFTNWTNLERVDNEEIAPFVIASYDIECTSGDGSFPQPRRDEDKVIQIGTTFNVYGNSECFYKHIITLNTCDPIDGVDVESYKTEREVLIAWTKLIRRMRPDIITGYNIFGFDYRYLEARSRKLGCASRFSKFGKLRNSHCKFREKELSSSALGNNKLSYYEMNGIVQVDLMKVIQRDFKLSSYKLDNVASVFIRNSVKKMKMRKKKKKTIITTGSTAGITVGRYVKILYNDGLSDNAYGKGYTKYKVINITNDTITIKGLLNSDIVMNNGSIISLEDILDNANSKYDKYKVYWCQAKDDVKPADIFRMQKGTSADRAVIASYCVQDCVICNIIMEKLQVITNNIKMANVSNVPLSYIFLRGQGVKILSLVAKKCRERNHLIPYIRRKYKPKQVKQNVDSDEYVDVDEVHFGNLLLNCKELGIIPTKKKKKKEKKIIIKNDEEEYDGYEGATVFRPQRKVHFNPIAVLDYGSLYPSSMIHRNISHECIVLYPEYENVPGYRYYDITFYNSDGTTTTRMYAKKLDGTMGIVPEILKDLLKTRSATKKAMAKETDPFKKKMLNGKQLALKITANSLYGQTGARTSAIYLRDIAASTTATGREMLHCARIFAEEIFPLIVLCVIEHKYGLFKKRLRMLFNKEIDKLLGKKTIARLKKAHYKDNNDPNDMSYLNKPTDYYYLRIFQERYTDLTDKDFENEKLNHKNIKDFMKYLYRKIRKALGDKTIDPECVYGDTDSIFVDLRLRNTEGILITGRDARTIAIKLSVLSGDLINFLLPSPQKLNYEKVLHPLIQLSKKRYVGNYYEYDPDHYFLKCMGIVLKRRDNAQIVKIVIGGIVREILENRSGKRAVEFTKQVLKDILSGKYPIDKFIITKTLRGNGLTKEECIEERMKSREERTYANRKSLAHVALADKMADRDPGNKPQSNDRIPFVYIETNKKKCLQGDRVENPNYVIEHGLKIDFLFYITNQIMKPAVQFLEKIVENAQKIFNTFITRELNRRKGKRPINYYFKPRDKSDDVCENAESSLSGIAQILMNNMKKKKRRKTKKKKKIIDQRKSKEISSSFQLML
uniref:DNA polymerase n=1 Tax=Mimivirus LCMiAC01 TaxID=2506608 RepID=A0A481Z0M3_9VIRU|nr:MAG: DNA polymerase family B elongation subunit [Mimivirus LCMiAC01]